MPKCPFLGALAHFFEVGKKWHYVWWKTHKQSRKNPQNDAPFYKRDIKIAIACLLWHGMLMVRKSIKFWNFSGSKMSTWRRWAFWCIPKIFLLKNILEQKWMCFQNNDFGILDFSGTSVLAQDFLAFLFVRSIVTIFGKHEQSFACVCVCGLWVIIVRRVRLDGSGNMKGSHCNAQTAQNPGAWNVPERLVIYEIPFRWHKNCCDFQLKSKNRADRPLRSKTQK